MSKYNLSFMSFRNLISYLNRAKLSSYNGYFYYFSTRQVFYTLRVILLLIRLAVNRSLEVLRFCQLICTQNESAFQYRARYIEIVFKNTYAILQQGFLEIFILYFLRCVVSFVVSIDT